MTTAVKIDAHCASNKEVVIKTFKEGIEYSEYVIDDGESMAIHIYDDLSVCAFEREKQ